MKLKSYFILTTIYSLFLFTTLQAQDKSEKKLSAKSAKEASKSFKKNEYLSALRFGIQALQGPIKKKKREKTVEITSQSYNNLVSGNLVMIEELSTTHADYINEETVLGRKKIVDSYDEIIKGINDTRRAGITIIKEINVDPASLIDYTPQKKSAEISYQSAVNDFVDEQYALAAENMSFDEKPKYRQAYFNFQNIKRYKAAFKDTDALQATALQKATYTVGIFTFSNKTGLPGLASKEYSITSYLSKELRSKQGNYIFLDVKPIVSTSQAFQSVTSTTQKAKSTTNLIDALMNNPTTEETTTIVSHSTPSRFPTPEELEQYDLVVYGSFYDPYMDLSEVSSSEKKRSKTIGKDENKTTVNAVFKSYKQTQTASIVGDIFVYNSLTKSYIVDQQEINGSYKNVLKWAKYSGNIKALKSSDKSQLKSKPPLKAKDFMFGKALDQLIISGEKVFEVAFNSL